MESYIAQLSKTGSGCYVALTISKAKHYAFRIRDSYDDICFKS